jgi:hypothetical protein
MLLTARPTFGLIIVLTYFSARIKQYRNPTFRGEDGESTFSVPIRARASGPLSVRGCTTGAQRARYRSAPDGIRMYDHGWRDAGPLWPWKVHSCCGHGLRRDQRGLVMLSPGSRASEPGISNFGLIGIPKPRSGDLPRGSSVSSAAAHIFVSAYVGEPASSVLF